MPRPFLFNRRGLAFPGGLRPGFDPNHPASQGCVFSGISTGVSAIDILKPSIKPTALVTAPTRVMDGRIGLTGKFPSTANNGLLFTGAVPAIVEHNWTAACIYRPTTLPGAATIMESSDGSGGWRIGHLSGQLFFISGTGGTNLQTTTAITNGVPYFIIISCQETSAGVDDGRFLWMRLDNGEITTAVVTGGSPGIPTASTGNFVYGGSSFTDISGAAACMMYANTRALSIQEMLQWAKDPWSFWYPTPSNASAFDPAWVETPPISTAVGITPPRIFRPGQGPSRGLSTPLSTFIPPAASFETNTDFVAKFTPNKTNLLSLLRQNTAQDITSTAAFETNTHFIGKFSPYKINLLPLLRQNDPQNITSTAAVETNPHFVGKFAPSTLSRLALLSQDVAADRSSTLVETNTDFIAKFSATKLSRLPALSQNIAADFTSTVAFETNTHFVSKFSPAVLAKLNSLWQNSALDSPVVIQPETNTHFIGRFYPVRLSVLPQLWQNTAQDTTSTAAFETNTHFVGKFSAPVLARLTSLWTSPSLDSPPIIQPETQPHVVGRFKPYQVNLLPLLRQNEPQDISVGPETNTHFVGRFAPAQLKSLASLRQNDPQDTTSTAAAETNVHFVGRFFQPPIAKLASLWQNPATDAPSIIVDIPVNFVGRFSPTRFTLQSGLRQNTAQDTTSTAAFETNVNFIGKFTPTTLVRTYASSRDTTEQNAPPPPVVTAVYNNPVMGGMGALSGIAGNPPS